MPASTATLAYVDLLSLEIVESDTSVTFVLANQAGFVTQATDPSPADRFLSHVIRFRLAGNDPVASVYLESSMPPGTPEEIYPTVAQFCFLEAAEDAMCYQGGDRLSFSTGGGKASITLPKDLLDNFIVAREGAVLDDIQALGLHDMSRQPPCCQLDSGWIDRLPDNGFAADFVFAASTNSTTDDTGASSSPTPEMPFPESAWQFLVIAGTVALLGVTRRRGSL